MKETSNAGVKCLVVAVAAALVALGWFAREAVGFRAKENETKTAEIPSVTVVVATNAVFNPPVEYVGHVEPAQVTDILPQVDGYIQRVCFTEGAFDHFVGELDSALYVSFSDPRKEKVGLVDRIAPFSQMVYNGVFVMNPFTRTVNFTAQEIYWQLKLIEFGGRPTFYFYSKFMGNGKNWMGDGDLRCATDGELAQSVRYIREGYNAYSRLSHLQYEFIEEHDDLGGGVWRTAYSNGECVYVNYGDTPAVADGFVVPANGWVLESVRP